MKKILNLIAKAVTHFRRYGFASVFVTSLRYLKSRSCSHKIDVVKEFAFVEKENVGLVWSEGLAASNDINWVIPSFSLGSGGHLNIFRFISYLEGAGYRVNIIIDDIILGKKGLLIKEKICENFIPLNADVFVGIENAPPAYATFATSWTTAYSVKSFRSTKYKFYFVQDFEPYFYPMSTSSVLAENTYKFGFFGITAGDWISKILSSQYGMECRHIGFSYDKDEYFPAQLSHSSTSQYRVFFYARPPTSRRLFELGFLALRKLALLRSDVQIVFAGWDLNPYELDFNCEDLGVVKLNALSDVYRSCDLGLVFSMTNLSLLPLELMACGVPVVSNRGENVEWLLNDKVCAFVENDINSIVQCLTALLDDKTQRMKLSEAGLAYARATSWEQEGKAFVEHFKELSKDKA